MFSRLLGEWVFGNDLEFRRTLDKDYRPGVVEDGPEQGTGPGLSLGYAFDAVGNLATLRNGKQNDPPLRIYGYDGLDRLTRIENAAATVLGSYGYDKTGNRTASGQLYTSTSGDDPTGPGGGSTTTTSWLSRTYSYVPTLHRLWTVGATERSYDSAGNTTRIGPLTAIVVDDPPPGDETGLESASYGGTAPTQSTGQNDGDDGAAGIQARTFDYSAANRMRGVSIDGVPAMSYRYNGKGERVYRSGSGDTVHSVYGEDGHWLGDYDANGSAIQQVIWFDGLPVAVLAKIGNTLKLHYIEADALGTPRAVIDPVRNVAVWRWDLTDEAFGESEPSVDPDNDGHWFVFDMRYPGQQYDSATGLNYNYFRDYDPSTGRYAQSDPIGLNGGISTYSYVGGNPLSEIDVYGLQTAVRAIPIESMQFEITVVNSMGVARPVRAVQSTSFRHSIARLARPPLSPISAGEQFNRQHCPGLPRGSLTFGEAYQIQQIAARYNTTIDVVGSRAAGRGRNIQTTLPVRKGRNGRSDIDFRIDSTHSALEAMIRELRGVGNGAGTAYPRYNTNSRPTNPPYIRFEPTQGMSGTDF